MLRVASGMLRIPVDVHRWVQVVVVLRTPYTP